MGVWNVVHPLYSSSTVFNYKKLSSELDTLTNGAVKIINKIYSRDLNSKLFTTLCHSMDSQHQHLLLYAEARWLSKRKVLSCSFELREEVKQFRREQNSALIKACILHFNELDIFLQAFCTNIFTLRNKTDAFKKKLAPWNNRVQEEDIGVFSPLRDLSTAVRHQPEIHIWYNNKRAFRTVQNFDYYYPGNENTHKGSNGLANLSWDIFMRENFLSL